LLDEGVAPDEHAERVGEGGVGERGPVFGEAGRDVLKNWKPDGGSSNVTQYFRAWAGSRSNPKKAISGVIEPWNEGNRRLA
jgi:hypothetical protein